MITQQDQKTFADGDFVRHRVAPYWTGIVVGWFATHHTPDGVNVELQGAPGVVLPVSAEELELWDV